eukprot:CAMPEP_0167806798 /NCGR_PEP_ID=MMETSP0111_2-20121227/22084_1 /TAXON_ID=91324 /ORGANISM="Lotharella globosa, Strain CCCM811" /LENGTH=175 /DNA_ID=CAMNT_0007704403 /DNA_START=40 /DNA_END=567 /DNA_ORIENTATION=-
MPDADRCERYLSEKRALQLGPHVENSAFVAVDEPAVRVVLHAAVEVVLHVFEQRDALLERREDGRQRNLLLRPCDRPVPHPRRRQRRGVLGEAVPAHRAVNVEASDFAAGVEAVELVRGCLLRRRDDLPSHERRDGHAKLLQLPLAILVPQKPHATGPASLRAVALRPGVNGVVV